MKKLITASLMAGLMISAIGNQIESPSVSQVQSAQNWVFLGERSVGDRVDRDTIVVTAAKGVFRRIQFRVRDHAVRILRLVVTYGNGVPDRIETRQLIPAGGGSRIIDLKGGDRIIRKIDFWYETVSLGRKRASVQVYGIR